MRKKRNILYFISYFFRKYFIMPLKIFRVAILDTIKQDGVEHAGYLAFLSILAFFPFLIFLVAIIGLFGASEVGVQVVKAALSVVPKEMADALSPRITEIISGPPQSFLTIAIIGIIWTASSSVEGCRTILNRAYRIAFPPPYLLRRLVSILEFFVLIFIIVAGIFIFIVAPTFLKVIQTKLPADFQLNYDAYHIRHIAVFVLLTISTSLLYYALPNAKQRITQTVPGSILVVMFWILLQKIFAMYLEKFHQFNLVYGSLAGVIISLMFFYLISLVFIFGAEFNYHFHRVYQIFLRKKK